MRSGRLAWDERPIVAFLRDRPLLTRFVSATDAEVLRALWDGHTMLAAIVAHVRREAWRDPDPRRQTTTIAQALRRLTTRRFVHRRGTCGGYQYTPTWPSEAAFVRDQLAGLLRGLLDDYPEATRAAWEAACST